MTDQMSIFDLVPDPYVKHFEMYIKFQDCTTGVRGQETILVTKKTWYDELQKWRKENREKYYFLGVDYSDL